MRRFRSHGANIQTHAIIAYMEQYNDDLANAKAVGDRAEAMVFTALKKLPTPWMSFETVEWRQLNKYGETVGEADVVVFHPEYGLVIFEIKAGAIVVKDGQWFYGSGLPMKQSPCSQARRNRYALTEKLKNRLGADLVDSLTITHAVWFPDVVWQGGGYGIEVPSRAFIFDRDSLQNPEPHLRKLFADACANPKAWSKQHLAALKDLLAPDCHQVVPLIAQVEAHSASLNQATAQQIAAYRMLRTQPRLLVEGPAGSGKTLLAVMLAKEHAALGKSVLLTCFNKNLAQLIASMVADVPGVTVFNFHELVRHKAKEAGLGYVVPTDNTAKRKFFVEDCPELLMNAVDLGAAQFDTVIVDEGADFAPTWWVALESLGQAGFSWYCFYDIHQAIYNHGEDWVPPFQSTPFLLDANLRNTKPIGDMAVRLGDCPEPAEYRVLDGIKPTVHLSKDFEQMGMQLKEALRLLIRKEGIAPEQIVVLAPYKHTNHTSTWAKGLSDVQIETDMVEVRRGYVRVGTIQGFKGLESDVVVLVGLDQKAAQQKEWLYVGASRARSLLVMLMLEAFGSAITEGDAS